MAEITRYPYIRHLRADASAHVQRYRGGRRVQSGRGLAFWFAPEGASISEIPLDDRELSFLVKGPSADHQEIAVQGAVTWRAADPEALGDRVDFTISLVNGTHLGKPLYRIEAAIIGLVRQIVDAELRASGVRALLEQGLGPMTAALRKGFAEDRVLPEMGIAVAGVRLASVRPSAELERALQVPTFEALQQKADEAMFARRALAVEKERAIAENELNTKVELAARRRELIAREDENARSEAEALAAARRIEAAAEAEAVRLAAEAESGRIRLVEQASVDMERARMEAYGTLSPAILFALAAQELAGKLDRIEGVTVTPDMLAGLMAQVKALAGEGAR